MGKPSPFGTQLAAATNNLGVIVEFSASQDLLEYEILGLCLSHGSGHRHCCMMALSRVAFLHRLIAIPKPKMFSMEWYISSIVIHLKRVEEETTQLSCHLLIVHPQESNDEMRWGNNSYMQLCNCVLSGTDGKTVEMKCSRTAPPPSLSHTLQASDRHPIQVDNFQPSIAHCSHPKFSPRSWTERWM